jgi:16S rRNA (guanine527-N7)-methyltransferase
MTEDRERRDLERGLRSLGLSANAEKTELLLAHVALIRQWAAGYNLVSRSDLGALVGRHVLDSLAIHSWITAGTLLDVGSGAGFPGLPLAIMRPELEVTLLDGSGKRIRFLRHVARTLGLGQLRIVHQRVEDFVAERPFSTIVSRAFGSLADFAQGVRHLADSGTRLLAVKGKRPETELEQLPGWVSIESVERYEVPNLHAERHVVIMALSPETA